MPAPVSRHDYWATLDALAKACDLEEAKYQAIVRGEPGAGEAMAAWWKVAASRWAELEAVLMRAEQEDWARAITWYSLWVEARKAGKPVGEVDAKGPWPVEPTAALAARKAETGPQRRQIEISGAV